ncbi:type II toxin-antitoxin system HicB family antitoxin [Methylococcus mesophilus]|uniref:type II toxin-antitoxin system HicB family antitoxin n=1 Tax=Methylococcus mesophilus TaxID=2993564 RepID=UPI00224A5BC1|nr:type II toxin-antitoxin system HicB family antitoxin [Methylococcus mesophilus]UZR29068.1 type II toxin-antitoxin system HicB family antitoxin [Methylococcus mesophilus]
MINQMTINGVKAVITYDPDIELFRGEFVGLNGGADFYAADVAGLKREGEISLKVFLEACQEDGVEPFKTFSGKFNVRIPPKLHSDIVSAAMAHGKSLNQWVAEVLDEAVHTRAA